MVLLDVQGLCEALEKDVMEASELVAEHVALSEELGILGLEDGILFAALHCGGASEGELEAVRIEVEGQPAELALKALLLGLELTRSIV